METIEAIYARHSTRAYTEEPLSEWQVDLLLKAAYCAPIGRGEYDSMQITVITDRDVLAEINEKTAFSNKGQPIYDVPALFLISAAPSGRFRNIHVANAACVAENILIAAADMHLQSIFLWGFIDGLKECPELMDQLAIEAGRLPVCAVGVGHAIEGLAERKNHHIDTDYI